MTPIEILKKPYARMVLPEPDGTFMAEIAEFPGCIATGDTAADALAALERVAESWLENSLADGHIIPEPLNAPEQYSGKLMLRMAKSVHAKAALIAKREGVSLNQFIVNAVSEQVGAYFAPKLAITATTAGFSQVLARAMTFFPSGHTAPSFGRETINLIPDRSAPLSYST